MLMGVRENANSIMFPFISISVLNPNIHLVEATQHIVIPVLQHISRRVNPSVTPPCAPTTAKRLAEYSVEEVASSVQSLGQAYSAYFASIVDNGLSGKVLMTFRSEQELTEVFSDIGITKAIHLKAICVHIQELQKSEDALTHLSRGGSSLVSSLPRLLGGGETRFGHLWWGTTYHMQTPLENLEEGTFLLIELCNATALTDTPECIAWCTLDLDRQKIDSISTKFELRGDPKPSNLQDISVRDGGSGSTLGSLSMKLSKQFSGANANASISSPSHTRASGSSTVSCELILSRRIENFNLKKIRSADNSGIRLLSPFNAAANRPAFGDRRVQSIKTLDFS